MQTLVFLLLVIIVTLAQEVERVVQCPKAWHTLCAHTGRCLLERVLAGGLAQIGSHLSVRAAVATHAVNCHLYDGMTASEYNIRVFPPDLKKTHLCHSVNCLYAERGEMSKRQMRAIDKIRFC